MRESGARNTKRAPTRLTPPSRRWVRLSAHYRTSDHDFFRWVLFRSARVSRPRRMADRKSGSFASVISQLFVLSHNPPTTNTRFVIVLQHFRLSLLGDAKRHARFLGGRTWVAPSVPMGVDLIQVVEMRAS